MGLWDTIMSDTVGVVYRAGTGKVDPWSQNEIIAQGTSDCVKAGGDPTTCQQNATQDTHTLSDQPSMSFWDAFQKSFGSDDGSGCGFSNPGGCMPFDPSYLPWILAGVGVLVLLWLVRPIFVAVEE